MLNQRALPGLTREASAPATITGRWWPALVGLALMAVATFVYWYSARLFDAGRPDFFYLADAFLHGRTWLTFQPGPNDVIVIDGRVYVPFAPFPALAFMPLIALVGSQTATAWQPLINSVIAAVDLGLLWMLLGRLGVRSLVDRFWLVLLLGFSTQIWWVVVRGGVWHTGHLIATLLTLAALIECWGRRRPWLLGLLAGAAFLTRAPLAFAFPFYAWVVWRNRPEPVMAAPSVAGGHVESARRGWWDLRDWPWRDLVAYAIGLVPSGLFFLWYNWDRFGSPLESGYILASLPPWLEAVREQGLFSLDHLGMNFDYLFLHLPKPIAEFPYFRPDGLGMSIFVTSPGLLLAVRAPWTSRAVGSRAIALALTAVLVLIPSLLYYGGGWLQYGYRYALDSIPFVVALCGLAAARRGIAWWWIVLILFGVVVGLGGVYWAYNLH